MKDMIKEETKDTRNIFNKFIKKDFSGNTGQAMKNSSWQITTAITAKGGSILFTIIIARLMLPELYGLYGLALSTILLIGSFSDLGIGTALTMILSKTIDKSPGKAKGYFNYLTKYKILLVIMSSAILLILAKWMAVSFYSKPIYYALLAGAVYLPITELSAYLNGLFISKNNFRPQFLKEVIFQVSRLTIVPLSIICFLSKISSIEVYLFWIFILISISYLIGGVYFLILTIIKKPFGKSRGIGLTGEERSRLAYFILPLTITGLSGAFFGYIDQIMLGHYVESQFLGFYQVAFNLVLSASTIIAFSSVAVFPIFARLKGKSLERGFRKTRNIVFLISIIAAICTFLVAPFIVTFIYGSEYATAIRYLKILSLLLISFPLISLYTSYYTSQEKTKIVSILLIASTIINIILNYIFINIGLNYSMFYAVVGACIATIISRYLYLTGLILSRRLRN